MSSDIDQILKNIKYLSKNEDLLDEADINSLAEISRMTGKIVIRVKERK